MDRQSSIGLKLGDEIHQLPVNRFTTAIEIGDGVYFQGAFYRIQGTYSERQEDGSYRRELLASTIDFYNTHADIARKRQPVFPVHDLDVIIERHQASVRGRSDDFDEKIQPLV